MSQDSPRIRLEMDGPVATIYLDHPSKLNVLDLPGWIALGQAVRAAESEDGVRCVVLRGVEGKAFSAGSDIGAFAAQRDTPDQVRDYGAALHGALEAIQSCRVPTLAVIEGLCIGGGLEIAACCDLRICTDDSQFGAPINRLGLTMAYEELAPLVALLGPGPVLEILLTGTLLPADRAVALGLMNWSHPRAAFGGEVEKVVRSVVTGAPLVNQWHKAFVRKLASGKELSADDRAEAYEAFQTEDYIEGRSAFVEKRPPTFRGE